MKDNSKRVGGQSTDGIGKDRISKDSNNDVCFNIFWSKYPKKISKKVAYTVWWIVCLRVHREFFW